MKNVVRVLSLTLLLASLLFTSKDASAQWQDSDVVGPFQCSICGIAYGAISPLDSAVHQRLSLLAAANQATNQQVIVLCNSDVCGAFVCNSATSNCHDADSEDNPWLQVDSVYNHAGTTLSTNGNAAGTLRNWAGAGGVFALRMWGTVTVGTITPDNGDK